MSQELLGHRDLRTTMIDTHVVNRGPGGVRSPADCLNLSAFGGALRGEPLQSKKPLDATDGAPRAMQDRHVASRPLDGDRRYTDQPKPRRRVLHRPGE